jgi:hypothetical protein
LVHERVGHLRAHGERKGAGGIESVRICRVTVASVMPSREERLEFGLSEVAAAENLAGGADWVRGCGRGVSEACRRTHHRLRGEGGVRTGGCPGSRGQATAARQRCEDGGRRENEGRAALLPQYRGRRARLPQDWAASVDARLPQDWIASGAKRTRSRERRTRVRWTHVHRGEKFDHKHSPLHLYFKS